MTNLIQKIILWGTLGVLTLVSLSLLTYHLAYQNKVFPGVKVLGMHIGNLTRSEVKQLLSEKIESYLTTQLELSVGEVNQTVSLEDLGLLPDAEKTAERAYQFGREKNLVTSLNNKFRSWTQGIDIPYQLSKDEDKLGATLSEIEKQILVEPKDAQIVLTNNNPEIKPSEQGLGLSFKTSEQALTKSISHLQNQVSLTTKTLYPLTSTEGITKAYEQIKVILEKNFVFKYQNQSFPISKETLLSLFSFSTSQADVLPVFAASFGGFDLNIESVNSEEKIDTYDLTASLSKEKSVELIDSIAKQVDRPAVDARFVFKNGKVENFTPSTTGLKVDKEASLESLQDAIENQTESIALSVVVSEPIVKTESVNDLGIKELIGRGSSKFVGSIPNRVYNISLAASRANGTLVAPGETFSMYQAIGEVDGTTGYREAYVINNNRTELDWGGGVCQVSTTLFRAALNAGLPIVERNPHAYRVGYYEQQGDPGNGKPGVDAAVYFPNVDFKFKNDTSHYILVQSIFDAKNYSLVFEIYGTSDGRKVSISTPVVSGQTPPPDPLYQDDPTLPKGTTKQVDWAAWGATTTFTRTVTRGGETLYSTTFYSKYRPWRAVYLVGTKEDTPAPAPAPAPAT